MDLTKKLSDSRHTGDVAGLLPCPFCGGTPYYTRAVNGSDIHRIGCSQCGIDFKAAAVHYPDPALDHLTRDIEAAWQRRCPTPPATAAAGPTVEEAWNELWAAGNPEVVSIGSIGVGQMIKVLTRLKAAWSAAPPRAGGPSDDPYGHAGKKGDVWVPQCGPCVCKVCVWERLADAGK